MLSLIIAAGLLSYLLTPVVNFICHERLNRGVVTFGLYLLLLAIVVWGAYAMIPVIDQQYRTILDIGSRFLSALRLDIDHIPDALMILDIPLDLTSVKQVLEPWIGDAAVDVVPVLQETLAAIDSAFSASPASSGMFRGTIDFGLGVINTGVSIILSFLFILFISLYLTKDAPRIRAFMVSNFPSQYQSEWVSLIHCVGNVWHAFFWGQVVLSVTISIMVYVVLSVLGVQGALILALIAGALEIIPNLGPIIALIPALLVGLTTGSTTFPEMNHGIFSLVIVGSYFVMQQLENNTIVPRLIGHFVKIHPILIIIGVTVGYLSNGVMGAFLASPLMGSARVLGTYVFAKLMDYPVTFPRTRSTLPLRTYDFSIVVHKKQAAEPGNDSDQDADPPRGPDAAETPAVPPADAVLDTPAH